MEAIKELIRPELVILIPVLYFIGMGLKSSALFADKYIPAILGAVGIVLSVIYTAATAPITSAQDVLMIIFVSATQGVLCAGCSVYVNQIAKQSGKGD